MRGLGYWVDGRSIGWMTNVARFRQPLFIALTVLGCAGLLWSVSEAGWRLRQNADLAALKAGRDVTVGPSSWDGLVQERVRYLDHRDRFEEARALIDEAMPRLQPASQSAVLYNHANAFLKRAVELAERGNSDRAVPLINLAKDAYRRALRIYPDNYDYKHNYDVAMRLVRDFPPGGDDEEDELATPKKLWTDLPGVPRGLP